MSFESVSDHTELFSSEDLENVELVDWNAAQSDSSMLISLLASWLSDVRDRLASENDIPTADLIDDLVLRLEGSGAQSV